MENALTGAYTKNWIRIFEVGDPQRHKKGFTVYKVTSKVLPKGDPGGLTVLTVWKRYNDFKKLHVELEKIHRQLYLRGKFPEFPKKTPFHRFEYEVIEERMKAATSLLQFAGNHVQLFTARIFNTFFEEGYDPTDLVHYTYSNGETETKEDKEQQQLPECLAPEIVWRAPDSNRHEDDLSVVSIGSDDIVSTSSDSLLSGSILGSFGASRSPPCLTPTSRVEVPKSQSHIIMPTFLATEHSNSSVRNSEDDTEFKSEVPDSAVTGVNATTILTTDPDHDVSVVFNAGGSSSPGLLPNFPNRRKEGKDSDDKLLSEALTSSYICEAAGHFAVAQDNESNGNFQDAFTSYKEGIRVLLDGAKSDSDEKRKGLVKKKLEKYLSLAENAHGLISSPKRKAFDVTRSPLRLFNPTNNLSNLSPETGVPSFSLDDLKQYKIVRIIDGKVYLVINLTQSTEPRCFVLKVLPFSMNPVEPEKQLRLPENVPFMAKLYKWFELDSAYIILVQYSAGGKLIDYIKSYQQRPVTMQDEISSEHDEVTHATSDRPFLEHKIPDLDSGVQSSSSCDEQSDLRGGDDDGSFRKSTCIYENQIPEATKTPTNVLKLNSQNRKCVDETHDNIWHRGELRPKKSEDEAHTSTGFAFAAQIPMEKENCAFGRKPSIDDLIESSKGLLAKVNTTLAKGKPHMSLAGEFLSKSLEDICLHTVSPNSFVAEPAMNDSKPLEKICNTTNVTAGIATPSAIDSETDEEQPILRSVPEGCIKGWAAEMIICLEKFHSLGLVYMDLAMHNILLGENGHILISLKAQWPNVDQSISPAIINEYTAPEIVLSIGDSCTKPHPSCDFWSLGALLFQIFTGQSVHDVHPEGFHAQTIIRIPNTNTLGEKISADVRSLLTELLEVNPTLRLGFYGAEEIKSHPCFDGFDWELASPVVG